ncbi:DUF3987 domain-containing protein [Luteimonas sp. MHLX1A]|uniref:DUF3987 domain-containing protein n=1 Tax=Alterluteimonas muca TaxID=2878684 RepID=UPI001E3C2DCC|nr:DUF3987 domain-containing protein [Luteimonas sp. MHLX1A]MCD9045937.1 DUF3987 domain-containing protein [Luteimonas sp. MHLX1A]
MLYPYPDMSRECPIDALPDLLFSAASEVRQLEEDVPAECLLMDAVAACVVPVQRLYDVQGLDDRTMPTTVFMLALAPSGRGKGTSYREFFKPLIEHNRQAGLAVGKIRARKRSHEKAGFPVDGPEFREPDGRMLTMISYRALMECLDGEARSVSINDEDGGSFLESDLFTRMGGSLTKLHSGFDLDHVVKDVDLIAIDGRCSLGIRLQGEVFHPVMKRTNNKSFKQGILGRAVVACHDPSRFEACKIHMPTSWPGGGMKELHSRLKGLMDKADKKQAKGELVRDKIALGHEAKAFMAELKFRLKGWRETCYDEQIEPAVNRAWENTLRIAAVFQIVCGKGMEISLEMVQRAWVIVQWSLTQHQMIFVEASKLEPKSPVARADGPFTKPWPAKIRAAKPPKPPRPIQDAQWLLECFAKVSGGRGQALLAEVIVLAGLRGPRLETAMAWLKLNGVVEIVGRGEDAMMRIPGVVADSSPRVLSHLQRGHIRPPAGRWWAS